MVSRLEIYIPSNNAGQGGGGNFRNHKLQLILELLLDTSLFHDDDDEDDDEEDEDEMIRRRVTYQSFRVTHASI